MKGTIDLEKKNAIYCCCISTPWLDVVKKLDIELNITPSYFIGWKGDKSKDINKLYPNCFYQTVENAWKGIGFPEIEYKYSLDEGLLKKISLEQIIAIKMMDRLDNTGHNFSFSDRQIFFNHLLKYWLVIIEKYNIQLVIFSTIPHRVFDYILYVASKIKHIDIIMFQMTPFSDSSFIINRIDHTPDYIKNEMKKNLNSKNLYLRNDILNRVKSIKNDYKHATPDYMIKQNHLLEESVLQKLPGKIIKLIKEPLKVFKEVNSYHVNKGLLPSKSITLMYQSLYTRLTNKLFSRTQQIKYMSLCTQNLNKKYIFVALHYQPEETSCPTGGLFYDQSLIIEVLNSFLDNNFDIVIKEHKTQFHSHFEGATGRSGNFYLQLKEISPRVKFVSTEADPFELIDNATATVTISGTIGWESVIRGTPTLIFGRAWYEDMIGVFKIKEIEDLRNSWSQVLKLKNNIGEDSILNYHKKLQEFFIDAPHYKAFVGKSTRTDEESCSNIVHGIKQHLKKIDVI